MKTTFHIKGCAIYAYLMIEKGKLYFLTFLCLKVFNLAKIKQKSPDCKFKLLWRKQEQAVVCNLAELFMP